MSQDQIPNNEEVPASNSGEPPKLDDYDFIFQMDNMYDLWKDEIGWAITINCPGIQEVVEIVLGDESSLFENNELTEEGINMLNESAFSRPIQTTDNSVELAAFNSVAIQGSFNSGKTFITDRLTGKNFASGEDVETKGISNAIVKDDDSSVKAFLFNDTAGQGRPINKEATVGASKELAPTWKKNYHATTTVDKKETVVTATTTATSDEPKKLTAREILAQKRGALLKQPPTTVTIFSDSFEKDPEFVKKARENAFMNKLTAQEFLQELIFDMADVIVVVVNEMTFPEQAFILNIVRKINDNNKRAANYVGDDKPKVKPTNLFVIHNYKSTNIRNMEKLRKIYVEDCFYAEVMKEQVSIPNGHSGEITLLLTNGIPGEDLNDIKLYHFFLAREDCEEAKKQNALYIHELKKRIGSLYTRHQDGYLNLLKKSVQRQLRRYYRNVGEIKIKASPNKKSLYLYHKDELNPISAIPTMGSGGLTRSVIAFSPYIDIIKDNDRLELHIDAPNISFVPPEDYKVDNVKNLYETAMRTLALGNDWKQIKSSTMTMLINGDFIYIYGIRVLARNVVPFSISKTDSKSSIYAEPVTKPNLYANELSTGERIFQFENDDSMKIVESKRPFGFFSAQYFVEGLSVYTYENKDYIYSLEKNGVITIIIPSRNIVKKLNIK